MLWQRISTAVLCWLSVAAAGADTLQAQREALWIVLTQAHQLSDQQLNAVKAIVQGSNVMGQGNPAVTQHPFSPDQCRHQLRQAGTDYASAEFSRICGAPYMAPLYDPAHASPDQANACIDQFEFPGVPCAYPVVWVRAREAAQICSAMGKRLCDAHEWEGACAGQLLPADYPFEAVDELSGPAALRAMRSLHNQRWAADKQWAYGSVRQRGNCAMNSTKHADCAGGDWHRCGSNTYPSGMFPGCAGALGVHDLHGNAAEHMNLPSQPSELASQGSKALGYTEMKGSWFIWDKIQAHPDWCRWRAPYWHGSTVMSPKSHRNYHLGFRCCKTIE